MVVFSERWRFEREDLSKLRSTAFGVDVAGQSEDSAAASWAANAQPSDEARPENPEIKVVECKNKDEVFKQLPFKAVDRNWKVVGRYKWKRVEPIPVLEARASLFAVKHALRSQSAFNKRHLVLSDSISAVCALERGRGKSFSMRRVTQQVCALTLASNTSFCYRWLPSEWNPADGPSRGSHFPARVCRLPKHDSSASPFGSTRREATCHEEEDESSTTSKASCQRNSETRRQEEGAEEADPDGSWLPAESFCGGAVSGFGTQIAGIGSTNTPKESCQRRVPSRQWIAKSQIS